jgi:transcriptional regulator with XRE-family HTH domain
MAESSRSPDDHDREIGRAIRRLRQVKRLSQAALAKTVGVTSQQVHKYEIGTNRVAVARLQQIADALGVPVSTFYAVDGKASFNSMFSDEALKIAALYDRLDQLDRRVIDDLVRALAKRPSA